MEVPTTILERIAADGPWAVLCLVLLWRLFRKEGDLLKAYREGAESVSALVSSMDKMHSAFLELRDEIRRR